MTTIDEGAQAPNFTLPGDNGSEISLSAYSGRPVVVYFYPKDNTSGCTKEAIAFNELAGEFEAAGIAIIGISPDPVASHDSFKAKHELTFALGADVDKSVAEAFGVWVEKSMYGRKYMGVERSTFLIDKDGKVARAWRKVKVPGHAEKVLEAAKAL
ncbi:thioredoxin-dependent thiol peroxidase [Acuticoccus sediminis]|uniref:thioredoxin-dependent peroxiredoxin n=1 Tax=Acuticoccus sediminis TaxID=2184697 RepID=A0A8B2NR61_9HYPH|nr:thioredoxin-dependent thiol peroxidase [Acuticoccus sediminis]RAI01162.1 thioredoxin-dependent thiol peroxidase [Acuticoccus sediminis]